MMTQQDRKQDIQTDEQTDQQTDGMQHHFVPPLPWGAGHNKRV